MVKFAFASGQIWRGIPIRRQWLTMEGYWPTNAMVSLLDQQAASFEVIMVKRHQVTKLAWGMVSYLMKAFDGQLCLTSRQVVTEWWTTRAGHEMFDQNVLFAPVALSCEWSSSECNKWGEMSGQFSWPSEKWSISCRFSIRINVCSTTSSDGQFGLTSRQVVIEWRVYGSWATSDFQKQITDHWPWPLSMGI